MAYVRAPMGGVGIDLLDVARFERALERRPRLAERLFTVWLLPFELTSLLLLVAIVGAVVVGRKHSER